MSDTDTTSPPAVAEASGAPAPLDPAIMEMLEQHTKVIVWHNVDNAATRLCLEEKKKAEPHRTWTWDRCRVFKQSPVEIAAVEAAIKNLKPKDAIEGMLVSQLNAVYLASIESLNNAAWEVDNVENRLAYLNATSKLSRTFAELTKALDHHRGKGNSQQTITVVHINDGGQAIVGNVSSQGRGAEKIAE